MRWIYGLCDMQSFYASCEVASYAKYALRDEHDDATDPPVVVAGDPKRRSGIILAATPTAKKLGVTTGMRLGEALRMAPDLIAVRPRMDFYMEVSMRIQQTMRVIFPKTEQFSIDEAFFAFPYPSVLFPDPVAAAAELKRTIWDLFKIRCRIGLADNKWLAKVANGRAKKHPDGIVWWTEKDLATQLHTLSVFDMWGLKRRAQVLYEEFEARTIGDVARIPLAQLRKRFGVWGEVIHRWSNGNDTSPINPDNFREAQKGYSHRTTLPKDFYKQEELETVILELTDEVCRRVRAAKQQGRRVGLGLTYASFAGGFYKAKTVQNAIDQERDVYPVLLYLLDKWWNGTPVRAVSVSLDDLRAVDAIALSLFEDVIKQRELTETVDSIRGRFGKTSLIRGVSLTEGSQLLERSKKIGGHYKE